MSAAALLRQAEDLDLAAAHLRERAAEMAAQEREAAVVDALALYDGPLTRRAAALAEDYNRYLGTAWSRESLSRTVDGSPKRQALHRLAVSRNGESLKARRLFDLAQKCNRATLSLHNEAGESDVTMQEE
jgi:hypothetical protein